MSANLSGTIKLSFGLIFFLLTFYIKQDQFYYLAGLYATLFGIYIYLVNTESPRIKKYDYLNLLIKIILVFAFPLASDDIYRFYWDGHTLLEGISPFQYTPRALMTAYPLSWQGYFVKLNSPDYYSVYPPVLQGLFSLCALLSFHSIAVFSIVLKSILLVADYRTIQLLKKTDLQDQKKISLWYAWNPLVIYEVIANGHPEGLMIFCMVAFIYYLKTARLILSSVMLSLAASVKIFPITLLLFIPKYLGFKTSLRYVAITFFVFCITMIPIYPFQQHVMDSLHLYYGKFEFNGSIFLLWKAFDYLRFGFDNVDHIAKWLSGCFMLVALYMYFKQKNQDKSSLIKSLFGLWLGYLQLSTTVHSWYVVPLILLGLLIDEYWIIVWSGVAILSYAWYDRHIDELDKYAFILIEYTVLLLAFLFRKRIVLSQRKIQVTACADECSSNEMN